MAIIGKEIAQGRTAQIYEYGKNKVIKLYFEQFQDCVDMEFDCCNLVQNNNISTPNALQKINIDGRQGIVFRRVDGMSLADAFGRYPLKVRKFAIQAAKTHHSINQIKSSDLPNQSSVLIDRINQVQTLNKNEKDRIISYCQSLPTANNLCHGDLHVENYMLSNGKLYAIDWLTACAGHPAGDIARTMLIMTSPVITDGMPSLTKFFVKAMLNIYNKHFLNTYLRLSVLNKKDIDKFLMPTAAARLLEDIPCEKNYLLNIVKSELTKLDEKENDV